MTTWKNKWARNYFQLRSQENVLQLEKRRNKRNYKKIVRWWWIHYKLEEGWNIGKYEIYHMIEVDYGLGMGFKMSPILAEIIMRSWEEYKDINAMRVSNYIRHVDDIIGISRKKEEDLREVMKKIEDIERDFGWELES